MLHGGQVQFSVVPPEFVQLGTQKQQLQLHMLHAGLLWLILQSPAATESA
jgi:hypothetical protein